MEADILSEGPREIPKHPERPKLSPRTLRVRQRGGTDSERRERQRQEFHRHVGSAAPSSEKPPPCTQSRGGLDGPAGIHQHSHSRGPPQLQPCQTLAHLHVVGRVETPPASQNEDATRMGKMFRLSFRRNKSELDAVALDVTAMDLDCSGLTGPLSKAESRHPASIPQPQPLPRPPTPIPTGNRRRATSTSSTSSSRWVTLRRQALPTPYCLPSNPSPPPFQLGIH